jgi:hypothetical protein
MATLRGEAVCSIIGPVAQRDKARIFGRGHPPGSCSACDPGWACFSDSLRAPEDKPPIRWSLRSSTCWTGHITGNELATLRPHAPDRGWCDLIHQQLRSVSGRCAWAVLVFAGRYDVAIDAHPRSRWNHFGWNRLSGGDSHRLLVSSFRTDSSRRHWVSAGLGGGAALDGLGPRSYSRTACSRSPRQLYAGRNR